MRKICFAILLVPALAWAQPKTAEDWYKEGENQYLLGNFDKAVEAFKNGFSLETDESKRANYLYNVAQSYRQANDCKQSLFFYRRFLALRDSNPAKPLGAKTRKDVNDWINELETCVQQQNQVSKRPPNTNLPPSTDTSDKTAPRETHSDPPKQVAAPGNTQPSDEEDRTDGEPQLSVSGRPRLFSARFTGGGTKVNAGRFDVPVQATFALIAGYPIAVNDKLTLEAGAAFTFTPVPYDTEDRPSMPARTKTAQLIGLMVNGGATYEVMPKFALRGDVGVGALFFNNVSASQFTKFEMTSGALSMFHTRLAVSADYAFTPNVIGTVTPFAFTYSPPKSGLDDSIKQITSFDFMLGIGYRM